MLKYSEIFYSLQGEGRFVGVPSLFLRFFGCNLSCPAFGGALGKPGQDKSPKEDRDKYLKMNFSDVKDLKEAEVPKWGCDSALSWHPMFKHLAKNKSIDQTVEEIMSVLPAGGWTTEIGNDTHLVLTGGEPMLWQLNIVDLIHHSRLFNVKNITLETNGTKELIPTLRKEFALKNEKLHVTWSISPKLSNSGETFSDAIVPEALLSYNKVENSFLYLKFVVGKMSDFEEAKKVYQVYRAAGVKIDAVYVMPEGALDDQLMLITNLVADQCLRQGFYYSPRLHIDLWGNKWGT